MENIFAGEIDEMSEATAYNDAGDTVVNITVKAQKMIGTIKTSIKRTVVLFRKDADKAVEELAEGDFALFTDVSRSPRIYQNKKGQDVEVVDLRANGFDLLTEEAYIENLGELNKLMVKDLDFTEDDRKMLEDAELKAVEADVDIN